MSPRRSARNQALPQAEADILNALDPLQQQTRASELYHAGWTLRAIGEAMLPPRTRSAMRSFIQALPSSPVLPTTAPLPAVTSPEFVTPEEYIPKKAPSPGIPPNDLTNIKTLAPLARKYRSNHHPDHPVSQANQGLTLICKALYADGVPISELAEAAGVTYRAMARRLGK
jgi:hypothetical protein